MNIKYLKIIVSLLLILCLCGIANAGTENKQSGKTGSQIILREDIRMPILIRDLCLNGGIRMEI